MFERDGEFLLLHTLCWQHECLAYGNIVGIAQAVVAEYGGHHGVGAVIAASDARKVVARFYLIINVLWCGVRVGLFAVFLCRMTCGEKRKGSLSDTKEKDVLIHTERTGHPLLFGAQRDALD